MDVHRLLWLATQAQTHRRIVEVGSFMGQSTRALADNTEGMVFAFDNWQGPWDVEMTTEERQAIRSTFETNLAEHLASGKVVMLTGDHRRPPTGLHPDMVFIDGDHAYESVLLDVSFWRAQLTPGGLLCGDDWDHVPVHSAILQLMSQPMVYENLWSVYV